MARSRAATWWRKHARIEVLLPPHERDRWERFCEVMAEISLTRCADPMHPTALEILAVRAMAAAYWRATSYVDDAEYLAQEVFGVKSHNAARRNEFLNAEHRSVMVRRLKAEVASYDELLEDLRSGASTSVTEEGDGKVVKLPVPPRRARGGG